MKKLILPAFALMVLAQWAIPIKMIIDSESVLTSGTEYKFRTEPVDPSDPFRGKYVTLRFNAAQFQTDTSYKFANGEQVYALLSVDSAGFAQIDKLYPYNPSDQGFNILKTKVRYASVYDGKQSVDLDFSFDRFYVEESKAPETERVYWDAQRDSTQVAYALVRLKNGQGIIRELMINDRPILEIVRELNEKQRVK